MHSISELAPGMENAPSWFLRGMEGVQLAPSAINQQKYRFTLKDGVPQASKGIGFYTAMDLGIAKYHFNEASGKEVFVPGA